MSRTDNTTPWKLWQSQGLIYDRSVRKYRIGHKSRVSDDRRKASRQQRRVAREVLRRGKTPEPYRPRHRVRYNAL